MESSCYPRHLFQATQVNPRSVQLMSRLQLYKARYTSVDYAALREFYQQAVAKAGEMLVLRRQ